MSKLYGVSVVGRERRCRLNTLSVSGSPRLHVTTTQDATTSTPSQQLIRCSRLTAQSTLSFHRTRSCPWKKDSVLFLPTTQSVSKQHVRGSETAALCFCSLSPTPASSKQPADQRNNADSDPHAASTDMLTQHHAAHAV